MLRCVQCYETKCEECTPGRVAGLASCCAECSYVTSNDEHVVCEHCRARKKTVALPEGLELKTLNNFWYLYQRLKTAQPKHALIKQANPPPDKTVLPFVANNNHVKAKLIAELQGEVLDLGCGVGGDFDRWQQSKVSQVHAVDVDPVELGHAQRRIEAHKLTKIRIECADMCTLELEPNKYDAIVAFFSIQYARDLRALFEKVRKALRKNGQFILMYMDTSGEDVSEQAWSCVAVGAGKCKFSLAGKRNTLEPVISPTMVAEAASAFTSCADHPIAECATDVILTPMSASMQRLFEKTRVARICDLGK